MKRQISRSKNRSTGRKRGRTNKSKAKLKAKDQKRMARVSGRLVRRRRNGKLIRRLTKKIAA